MAEARLRFHSTCPPTAPHPECIKLNLKRELIVLILWLKWLWWDIGGIKIPWWDKVGVVIVRDMLSYMTPLYRKCAQLHSTCWLPYSKRIFFLQTSENWMDSTVRVGKGEK